MQKIIKALTNISSTLVHDLTLEFESVFDKEESFSEDPSSAHPIFPL